MPKTIRHTVQVRPAMHYIGAGPNSGKPAPEPQGYEVEFYLSGEFVQRRSYTYSTQDERTMMRRLYEWTCKGELEGVHKHNWVEADAEPPYDVCNSCGEVRH